MRHRFFFSSYNQIKENLYPLPLPRGKVHIDSAHIAAPTDYNSEHARDYQAVVRIRATPWLRDGDAPPVESERQSERE